MSKIGSGTPAAKGGLAALWSGRGADMQMPRVGVAEGDEAEKLEVEEGAGEG